MFVNIILHILCRFYLRISQFNCITINATVSGDHCTLQRNKNIFIQKQLKNKDGKGMTFVLIRACQ